MCEQNLKDTLYYLLSSYSCVKNITPESSLLQGVMMDRRDVQQYLVDVETAFSTDPIDLSVIGFPQTAGQLIDSISYLLSLRQGDLRYRAKCLLDVVKPSAQGVYTEREE
jgi:hypothetical protein